MVRLIFMNILRGWVDYNMDVIWIKMELTKEDILIGIGFAIVIPFAILAWILTCSARLGERMLDDFDGVKKWKR